MKELFVLRHAEAENGKNKEDRSRALTFIGKKQLERLTMFLKEKGTIPDVVYCSPARRASQTAQQITKGVGFHGEVIHEERIYNAHVKDLTELLAQTEQRHASVLLVGHNPSVGELVKYLTGVSFVSMATGQLIAIGLEMDDWAMLSQGIGMIKWES